MTVPFAFLAGMIASVFGLLGIAIQERRAGRDPELQLRRENQELRARLRGAPDCPTCRARKEA